MSTNITQAAEKLLEAIYANLQPGTIQAATDTKPTECNFLVGVHIREELETLEKVINNENT